MSVSFYRYRGPHIEIFRRQDECGEYFEATLNGVPVVTWLCRLALPLRRLT
jgi:hypothetical protein